jgi:beta-galactosidase
VSQGARKPAPAFGSLRPPATRECSVDDVGLRVGELALGWPEANLWRPPTDNDDPPGAWRGEPSAAERWRAAGLDRLEVVDQSVRQRGDRTTRTTSWAGTTAAVVHRQVVTVLGGSSGLRIDERIDVGDGVVDPPRVGVSFVLPPGAEQLEWFGLGPGDCYPDRRAAARLGRWRVAVADQEIPFVAPQEYGLHLETRWFALGPQEPLADEHLDANRDVLSRFASRSGRPRGAEGTGGDSSLEVSAGRPFAFSALPYSAHDLTSATHADELALRPETYVHLDIAHRGLGTAACGPDTAERHRLKPGTYRITWYLR